MCISLALAGLSVPTTKMRKANPNRLATITATMPIGALVYPIKSIERYKMPEALTCYIPKRFGHAGSKNEETLDTWLGQGEGFGLPCADGSTAERLQRDPNNHVSIW